MYALAPTTPSERLTLGRCRYDRNVSSLTSKHSFDEAFARGEADLRAVYDAHSSLVYSLCRRALGAEAAKDATQEVFVSVWRKREQFDPSKGALGAWIVGIAKRRIIDQTTCSRWRYVMLGSSKRSASTTP